MPIYSNLNLSWPQCLQVFQQTRVYPGKWYNYNLFRIVNDHPLKIHSYSPIKLLQEDRKYYCYNIFENEHQVQCDNVKQLYTLNNGFHRNLYLPSNILAGDIILVVSENDKRIKSATGSIYVPHEPKVGFVLK